jgi:hypothetical protein
MADGISGILSKAAGLTPWGMAANVVGAGLNVVGAIGQSKEAKRQFDRQTQFGQQQKAKFTKGYGDLINQAQGLKTYQGDISKYVKAEQAAELGKRMAGGGRVAGEDIMREQARQSTANTLAFAQRAGGSSSDLLTAALMGQQQEGTLMQNIDITSQQTRQNMQQRAQDTYLATLGQTAAAQAQQAGLQFESESGKQQQLLGLAQGQFQGGMALDQSLFEQQQASAAAVQNAKSAIWSGIGGIASGIGSGLMGVQAQDNNMKMLQAMYNPNAPSSAAQGFKRFSMGLGQNPTIDFKTNISTRYPSADGAQGLSSFLNPPSYPPLNSFQNQPFSAGYSSLLNPMQPRNN